MNDNEDNEDKENAPVYPTPHPTRPHGEENSNYEDKEEEFLLSDVGKAHEMVNKLNEMVRTLSQQGLRVQFDEYTHTGVGGHVPQFRLAVYKEVFI